MRGNVIVKCGGGFFTLYYFIHWCIFLIERWRKFTPFEMYLAAVSSKKLSIYVSESEEVKYEVDENLVALVAFSSDNLKVAVLKSNGIVDIVDLATGVKTCQVETRIQKSGSECLFFPSLISDTTATISVVVSAGLLKTWNALNGELIHQTPITPFNISKSCVNHNLAEIVCGQRNGTMSIIDYHTGENKRDLVGHTRSILQLSVSHLGDRLVSVCQIMIAIVWDNNSGNKLFRKSFVSHDLTFSLDSSKIISFQAMGTLTVWDLQTDTTYSFLCEDLESSPKAVFVRSLCVTTSPLDESSSITSLITVGCTDGFVRKVDCVSRQTVSRFKHNDEGITVSTLLYSSNHCVVLM